VVIGRYLGFSEHILVWKLLWKRVVLLSLWSGVPASPAVIQSDDCVLQGGRSKTGYFSLGSVAKFTSGEAEGM